MSYKIADKASKIRKDIPFHEKEAEGLREELIRQIAKKRKSGELFQAQQLPPEAILHVIPLAGKSAPDKGSDADTPFQELLVDEEPGFEKSVPEKIRGVTGQPDLYRDLHRIHGDSEKAMHALVYGAVPFGIGLGHLSLVYIEGHWQQRLDSLADIERAYRGILEADVKLSPGGLIVFSPDISRAKGLPGIIFERISNWLRRTVPEMVPFIAESVPERLFRAIERAGGIGATTLKAGEAAKVGLIAVPADGLWRDSETDTFFDESSFLVWVAGVEKADIEQMAKEIKKEFNQKSVMYVPLDTRIVGFV